VLLGAQGPVVAGQAGITAYWGDGVGRWTTGARTSAVALDPAGNLYAVEWSEEDDGWVTASYDSEGNLRWVESCEQWSRWAEPASKALAVDSEGNVYVTGSWATDIATTKYVQTSARFRRGDANDDGEVDLSDALFILDELFLGGPKGRCLAAANNNGDAAVDLSDAVYLLGFLFLGKPAPPEPFEECGPSPLEADAGLGCVRAPRSCR
jgi:hypothetical protein